VEDSLVDRFQLSKVYGTRLEEDAQEELQDNTAISEDRKSGIITIAVTDRNPQRAAAMAGEYVEELNRVVTELNTSSAHRERVFLEGRLAEVKQDLESAEKGFSEFASKNTAIDIQAQGKAMIESAATLEGQMVAAQTELQGLKQIYAGDNVRVRTIQARVDELDRQLQKLGGKFDTAGEPDALDDLSSKDPSMYPSIRKLPLLGVSYADLYVNPQPTPEELREFYAGYDDGEQWRTREENFNRGVRRAILRSKPSGAVLDIGCGSGNFLRCMKEAGFSAFGIEPSESGSDFAREEHGIEIYRGMIEEYFASANSRQFDVVTLLNVLEHLSDPSQTLSQIRQILAPGGVLAVVVPDARFHDLSGRLRRALGLRNPYWLEQSASVLAGFKLPDHLCSFQPRTIESLLENCGFRLIKLQNAPLIFNAGLHRNLGKIAIRWASQALHFCSFERVLVGYSTLVLARKERN
jgi:SAM-dependent methyltransferase